MSPREKVLQTLIGCSFSGGAGRCKEDAKLWPGVSQFAFQKCIASIQLPNQLCFTQSKPEEITEERSLWEGHVVLREKRAGEHNGGGFTFPVTPSSVKTCKRSWTTGIHGGKRRDQNEVLFSFSRLCSEAEGKISFVTEKGSVMKGNRIRTTLKGAERRRIKKKDHYFELIYRPYSESGYKGFIFERFIQILAEMSPLWNMKSQGIEPPARVAGHLCAREKDVQRHRFVGRVAKSIHWGVGFMGW